MTANDIQARLRSLGNPKDATFLAGFFKTGPGQYGEGDVFIGVRVPAIREVAKEFKGLPLAEVECLLHSPIHEERLAALVILVMQAAKADAPDADKAHKVSAGAAHSTLGYAYMKQDKTAAAIPELRAATVLLKDQSDQDAIALYRLGFAYAKLSRVSEARQVLLEAVSIPGPVQKPAQDLLLKVNAARTQGR